MCTQKERQGQTPEEDSEYKIKQEVKTQPMSGLLRAKVDTLLWLRFTEQ